MPKLKSNAKMVRTCLGRYLEIGTVLTQKCGDSKRDNGSRYAKAKSCYYLLKPFLDRKIVRSLEVY